MNVYRKMNDLKPEQLLCRRDFVTTEVFPSKECSKDFSILEASGRADLFALLEEEFPHARVEQLQEQKIDGQKGEPFDYIAAAGFKYIPCDRENETLFSQLLARLKPGGVISAAVCGFSGYYGLVMLGSIVETLSRDKTAGEGVKIAEAVLRELPPTHPVFETGQEDFLQRLKSGDETAFEDLMTLTRSIPHIDGLYSVSTLMEAIPRWGGQFIRWVSPPSYDPSSTLERINDLPEPRRSIVFELVTASPPDHYFLLGK